MNVVVCCVRDRESHLLRAAVRRGIAYTSIAPPWMPWAETQALGAEAKRTGARVILAAGLEPGISSVMVRAAADRLAVVDSVETALLLGLGDAYGGDSMGFIFEELTQPYSIMEGGSEHPTNAFERPKTVAFPQPVGMRRAYTMPFRDQLYYPSTLGAKTAIARLALDPPWLGEVLAALLPRGLRRVLGEGRTRGVLHGLTGRLAKQYAARDHYALVVEVKGAGRTIRSTLVGHGQAEATAVGVGAIADAMWLGEVDTPGVWLAEQVIDPKPFFARLAAHGIVPTTEESPPSREASNVERPVEARMAT